METLGVALQVRGLVLVVPACIEICLTNSLPGLAVAAALLVCMGIAVLRAAS